MPTGAGRDAYHGGLHRTSYVGLVASALALSLSACASDHAYAPAPPSRDHLGTPSRVSKDPPSIAPAQPLEIPSAGTGNVADLTGWSTEDHIAAFSAFRAGCKVVKEPALQRACASASRTRVIGDVDAKRFFEQHFRVEVLPGEGVLTGYFAPVYPARAIRDSEFSAPVRPPPPPARLATPAATTAMDPLSLAKGADRPAGSVDNPIPGTSASGDQNAADDPSVADPIAGLLDPDTPRVTTVPPLATPEQTQQSLPLRDAERAIIEQSTADDAIAWMRPEDLFFMQIQGSGVLVFPDGERKRAAYAGDNGKPFVGIARVMVHDGLLPQNGASGDAIRRWLSAHAGAEADQVMRRNPRYVFFRVGDDARGEPMGAAGVPLPPGRAIAMDATHHTFGAPYWIDAEAPSLAGAAPQYHRLAVALDTGGAIRGPIRADLYFGTGDVAGREAGRVKHVLRLARLVPIDVEPTETGDASTARSGRR